MQLLTKYQDFCQNHGFTPHKEQISVIHTIEKFEVTLLEQLSTKKNQSFLSKCLQIFFPAPQETLLGVYIYGGVGRGKSMVMDLFYQHIPIKEKKRIHFHSFMQDTHKLLRQARSNNEPDALLWVADYIANECRLLCFDEFQVLDITDAMILGRLFKALIERGMHFIMTSNRPPKDLYLKGLNRQLFLPFIDLLNKRLQIVTLDHEIDFRFEKIRHQDHYISPLNAKTHQQFDAVWSILTDYYYGEPRTLENAGRKIILKKTCKHIAYEKFNDLCDTALGASDYLLIADQFSVLLLDEIPQLTSDMRNQATRFRNLIDAFYEKRHKIYFRCAVPIESLYIKGDYHFEFERTISRIQEMQAKDY
ncbi:MAG: cell division protein ZapE [Alphaproteobacteria bacterium]|jgi:cell division protein ZapE